MKDPEGTRELGYQEVDVTSRTFETAVCMNLDFKACVALDAAVILGGGCCLHALCLAGRGLPSLTTWRPRKVSEGPWGRTP